MNAPVDLAPADLVQRYVTGRQLRVLVGGELVEAEGGATTTVLDPSTGRELAQAPSCSRGDVDRAVAAAKRAQPAWAALSLDERSAHVLALADAVEGAEEELATLDAIDGGNPLPAMRRDVAAAIRQLRAWPALVRWQGGRTIPATPSDLHHTSSVPYGVVGKILPYNHPALFVLTRVVPPLLAGNAVVVKPAWQTPLSALRIAELAAGLLPPGVLSILTGGTEPGDALVVHPDVRRLGFIGSVPVGMRIQQRAAEVAVKAVTLELGGKNPMVVFPDADVEATVAGAIAGMNFGVCQGQSCGSTSRVFVHRRLYADFLDAVKARLEAMVVGCAYRDGVEMGPLVTAEHRDRVLGYVESGRAQGARLVTGGEPVTGGHADPAGYFVAPTVFADVRQEMTIAREEVFGPLMSVAPWDDWDTVVAQANDTEFGLTASVWTNDLTLAHSTAARLEAGYVWINEAGPHYWGTPFGGMKNSGLGREEGLEEYLSHLQTKVVHTVLGQPAAALRRLAGA